MVKSMSTNISAPVGAVLTASDVPTNRKPPNTAQMNQGGWSSPVLSDHGKVNMTWASASLVGNKVVVLVPVDVDVLVEVLVDTKYRPSQVIPEGVEGSDA